MRYSGLQRCPGPERCTRQPTAKGVYRREKGKAYCPTRGSAKKKEVGGYLQKEGRGETIMPLNNNGRKRGEVGFWSWVNQIRGGI